jgi:hypothetical protein
MRELFVKSSLRPQKLLKKVFGCPQGVKIFSSHLTPKQKT